MRSRASKMMRNLHILQSRGVHNFVPSLSAWNLFKHVKHSGKAHTHTHKHDFLPNDSSQKHQPKAALDDPHGLQ
jgi:hypothetical protein